MTSVHAEAQRPHAHSAATSRRGHRSRVRTSLLLLQLLLLLALLTSPLTALAAEPDTTEVAPVASAQPETASATAASASTAATALDPEEFYGADVDWHADDGAAEVEPSQATELGETEGTTTEATTAAELQSEQPIGEPAAAAAADASSPLELLQSGPWHSLMDLLRGSLPGAQSLQQQQSKLHSTASPSSGSAGGLLSSLGWPVLGAGAALLLGAVGVLYAYYSDRSSSSNQSRGRSARAPLPPHLQPLLVELKSHRGRVQGLDWVDKTLIKDDDGDEAHEHLGPF